MGHVIQVELRTDTTHTLTWLDAALKPKPGMVLLCDGDPRSWTVVPYIQHDGSGNEKRSHQLEVGGLRKARTYIA